ncbi:MAG TPA: hypothetical protein VHZ07_04175 [Bryobacteraceae bacterium]|nr:hypothetical protein [Bryobacteraceae bacterium]
MNPKTDKYAQNYRRWQEGDARYAPDQPLAEIEGETKLRRAIAQIYAAWEQGRDRRTTQLVFCGPVTSSSARPDTAPGHRQPHRPYPPLRYGRIVRRLCVAVPGEQARFINQVMNGSVAVHQAEDLDAGALTFAEIKAIASGNPAVMEKVNVDTEVRKLDPSYHRAAVLGRVRIKNHCPRKDCAISGHCILSEIFDI